MLLLAAIAAFVMAAPMADAKGVHFQMFKSQVRQGLLKSISFNYGMKME